MKISSSGVTIWKSFKNINMLIDPKDLEKMPNQKWHQIISFIKSGIRIAGAVLGIMSYIPAAFVLFLIAEVVGIYEELV